MSERLCPSCGLPYGAATTHCPIDGTALIALDASVHDPLIGRTLSDRFQILSRIGSGGMGTVYRARQLSLGRDVRQVRAGGVEVALRDPVHRSQAALIVHQALVDGPMRVASNG